MVSASKPEASKISVTPETKNPLSSSDMENSPMLKGKGIPRSQDEPSSCDLDLKLSNYVFSSKEEVNAICSITKKSSLDEQGSSSKDEEKNRDQPMRFLCKYCNKEYSTSQALGGHQKAHKMERALAKSHQGFDMVPHALYSRLPSYPYSNFPSMTSFGGGYVNRSPLGVKMDSALYKPLPMWPSSRFTGYGGGVGNGWSSQTTMSRPLQPSIDAWKVDGLTGSYQRMEDKKATFISIRASNISMKTDSGNPSQSSSDIDLSLKL